MKSIFRPRLRQLPEGWGAYRPDPWKWGGRLYQQRRYADAMAARLGPGFVVAFGSYDEEQDVFFVNVGS